MLAVKLMMKLIRTLSILFAVAGCAAADLDQAPRIDGILEAGEWKSAEVHALQGGGNIRLRRIENDLYIAVSAIEHGFPTVFVGNSDAVEVLHASAAQASVTYTRSGDSWIPADASFDYTLRQDSGGQQAPKAARDEFLKNYNWLSTSDRSHGADREFLVRLHAGRRYVAVSFLGIPSMSIHGWPEHLPDSTKDPRLLRGEVPLDLKFSPNSWHPAGWQPGNR